MRLGVAGVDMLQSSSGPLILEVNSSPGLEGIEIARRTDIGKKLSNTLSETNKKNMTLLGIKIKPCGRACLQFTNT